MMPLEPPSPYCSVAPESTMTVGGSGSVMIGYGQFPPLVVTRWRRRVAGSVMALSLVSTRVPVPAIVSVPWPEKTPLYVVVPPGRVTIESPESVTSWPAST